MKTQIGLPVHLFGNTPKGREVFAATIVDLRDTHAETDLMVFNKDGSSFLAPRIRHKDFKKDGENYWDFLEEDKKELKAREYKMLQEASPRNNWLKRFFCKHLFVAHRLDKILFEYDADNLYITCKKCGQQYIIKKFFDNSNTSIKA